MVARLRADAAPTSLLSVVYLTAFWVAYRKAVCYNTRAGEVIGSSGFHLTVYILQVMYFALSGFDVAISKDKKALRKFARNNLRFAGLDLKLGFCRFQTFTNPASFKAEFGSSIIYDLDQRLVFRPDFSVVRSF